MSPHSHVKQMNKGLSGDAGFSKKEMLPVNRQNETKNLRWNETTTMRGGALLKGRKNNQKHLLRHTHALQNAKNGKGIVHLKKWWKEE